jgi:hypothetical protein
MEVGCAGEAIGHRDAAAVTVPAERAIEFSLILANTKTDRAVRILKSRPALSPPSAGVLSEPARRGIIGSRLALHYAGLAVRSRQIADPRRVDAAALLEAAQGILAGGPPADASVANALDKVERLALGFRASRWRRPPRPADIADAKAVRQAWDSACQYQAAATPEAAVRHVRAELSGYPEPLAYELADKPRADWSPDELACAERAQRSLLSLAAESAEGRAFFGRRRLLHTAA